VLAADQHLAVNAVVLFITLQKMQRNAHSIQYLTATGKSGYYL